MNPEPVISDMPFDPSTKTWSKDEVLRTAAWFRQKARQSFLEHKSHIPMSFLFATRSPNDGSDQKATIMVPVVGGRFDNDTKEAYSRLLKMMAAATRSVGIIFITEMWMVQTEEKDKEEALRKYTGSLANHPDREEHLMLTCEHSRFGSLMWTARIHRPDGKPDGDPTLDEWKGNEGFKNQGGRFAHLLPQVD